MIPWLESRTPFPPVEHALTAAQGAAGLLAAGADLSAPRLLDAYHRGIFPWFSKGQPILWWSTDPRMVLYTDEFRLAKNLDKKIRHCMRSSNWEFRFDHAFEDVMRACAAPRKDSHETWITDDIITAYCTLHRLGHAHSSETWLDGELVGGAYGVCIGKMFYGESMFTRVSDASKMALAQLVFFLRKRGVQMIDCQQDTAHLASLGARPIPRQTFTDWLVQATAQPEILDWPSFPGDLE